MNNNVNINDISIEQFAAFLDGNLTEEDMQTVALAIDANNEYSDILSEVMMVDDAIDIIANQEDVIPSDILDADFELPIIPIVQGLEDQVELHVFTDDSPVTLTTVTDNEVIAPAAIHGSEIEEIPTSSMPHTTIEDIFIDTPVSDEQESIDFGDLA